MLPPGKMPFCQIEEYLQNNLKFNRNDLDYKRIEKIVTLKADKIYCGNDDFDGYLVFYFEKIKIAILDCPRKGNAVYIFGSD